MAKDTWLYKNHLGSEIKSFLVTGKAKLLQRNFIWCKGYLLRMLKKTEQKNIDRERFFVCFFFKEEESLDMLKSVKT